MIMLMLPVLAQETLAVPVLTSGSELCAAVEPLAAWMGATCQPGANDQVKITLGKATVQMQAASLIYTDTRGWRGLWPTLPVRINGALYLPVRPLLPLLGGTVASQADGGLLLTVNGKSGLLPPVAAPALPEAPLERTVAVLHDPRVPLDALLSNYDRVAGIRPYLDGFNKLASPVKPTLETIAKSQTLRLMTNVPLAGTLIRIAQDTAGTLNETIGLAGKVAQFDRECLAPIREGLTASAGFGTQVDAVGVQAARAKWSAAVPAIDKLITSESGFLKSLRTLNTALGKTEKTLAEFRKSYPKSEYVLSVQPLLKQTADVQLRLGAHQWQLAAMKDYFTRLLAESANVQ
jgi:hypothetical protein